jgi:hypothetical protein
LKSSTRHKSYTTTRNTTHLEIFSIWNRLFLTTLQVVWIKMRLLGLIIKWRLEDEYGTLNNKSTKNSTTPNEYNTTQQVRHTTTNSIDDNLSPPIIQKENGFV